MNCGTDSTDKKDEKDEILLPDRPVEWIVDRIGGLRGKNDLSIRGMLEMFGRMNVSSVIEKLDGSRNNQLLRFKNPETHDCKTVKVLTRRYPRDFPLLTVPE